MTTVGVLLAGGRSERLGSDKALADLAGKPLIERAAARLKPQVDRLIVSANGDPSRFAFLDLPVVPDADGGGSGPLAGILACLAWTRANAPTAAWIATASADVPFAPSNLVARLAAATGDGDTVRIAASNGQMHYTIALWPVTMADDLAAWLAAGHSKAVHDWIATRPHIAVDFDTRAGLEPFFNVNTPEDLDRARVMIEETGP